MGFVCVLFLLANVLGLAGVFGMRGVSPQTVQAGTPEAPGALQEMWDKVGVRAHCWDSRDGQSHHQHASNNMAALYNTTGFLAFSFRNQTWEDRISDIDIEVVRLGAPATENWVGDDDLEIESHWFSDELERDFAFRWNYRAPTNQHRAVGIYRITIFVEQDEVDHEVSPSCIHTCRMPCEEDPCDCDWHCDDVNCEHTWHCKPDCEMEDKILCRICEHRYELANYCTCEECECDEHEECECDDCECEREECECDICGGSWAFAFNVICSSTGPEFGVTLRHGSDTNNETARFATRTDFTVSARARDHTFYWHHAEATYIVPEDCEFLTASENGKSMKLNMPTSGKHTLKFTVVFDFVEVDNAGNVTIVRGKEVPVELEIEFFNNPRPPQWWEVLIGIAVLAALGGTVWFINRLSKNVEYQQK